MKSKTTPRLQPGDAVLDVNLLMEGFCACEGAPSHFKTLSADDYKHTRYVASFLQLLESVVLNEQIWPNTLWSIMGDGGIYREDPVYSLEKVLYQEGILVNYNGLATLTDIDAVKTRASIYFQVLGKKSRILVEIAFSETAHVQILPDFDYIQQYASAVVSLRKKIYRPLVQQVYSSLSQGLQKYMDEIVDYTRTDEVLIPPISAIILNKASSVKDISEILLETRNKMKKLRSAFREYEEHLRDKDRPLKDRIRIIRDIQLISYELSKPYDYFDSIHLTELPDIWSFMEDISEGELSLSKLAGKLLDKPLRYLIKRLRLRNAHYLFSLRQKALSAPNQLKKINTFFGPVNIEVLKRFLNASRVISR